MCLLLLITISACATPYTPEQIAQMQAQRLKIMKAYQERLKSAQSNEQQSQAVSHTQVRPQSIPNESDLASKINGIPQLPPHVGVIFSGEIDGFTANGKRYIDPEGEIKYYAFDGLTGDVTYMAQTGENSYVIKFVRVSSGVEPITIAHVMTDNASEYRTDRPWKATTITGKKISGNDLFMTSRGFVIVRQNSAFLYSPGKGITSIAAPNGYHIASYQRGDIASTKYILLERDQASEGSVGSLVSSVRDLGGILGGEGNKDYALYNIISGKVHVIPVGYKPQDMGGDPRYDYHGQGVTTKNSGHYFWRILWFKTDAGVYAIYTANGIRDVEALHLDSGFKKQLFHRGLGVVSINAGVTQNGKISVSGNLGFETKNIDDLEKFMAESIQG